MASSCSRALRCLYATHSHQCHVVGGNDPVRVAHEDVLAVSLDEFRVTQQKPGFHQPYNPLPNRKPLEPGPGAPLWAKRRPIKVLHNICGHHPHTNSVLPPGQRPKPFYPVGSEKSCHQAYDAAHKRHGCGCVQGLPPAVPQPAKSPAARRRVQDSDDEQAETVTFCTPAHKRPPTAPATAGTTATAGMRGRSHTCTHARDM